MRKLTTRFAAFLGLWWVVSDGTAGSWLLGVPAAATAAYVSWRLRGQEVAAVMPLGLVRFAAFLARESVKGGFDVAARAFWPTPRIRPSYVRYRMNLSPGLPRRLFACAVSVVPGTLAVEFDGDVIVVHVLDMDGDPWKSLQACERILAGAFARPDNRSAERSRA